MQEVSELRLEITHDARTRKIRPGSDLRHDVQYIYIYIYRKIYSKLVYVGLAQARPNYGIVYVNLLHKVDSDITNEWDNFRVKDSRDTPRTADTNFAC